MDKKKNNWIIIVLIILAIFAFSKGGVFKGAITGDEIITRSAPPIVSPSSTFSVTYTVSGDIPPWGVSVRDFVSGGCTPSDTIKFVITSDATITQGCTSPCVKTFTAPASEGACSFIGDYQFGTLSIVPFSPGNLIVDVQAVADCPTLKSTALSSIVTWSGDPTSTNKNAALTAIVNWASQC